MNQFPHATLHIVSKFSFQVKKTNIKKKILIKIKISCKNLWGWKIDYLQQRTFSILSSCFHHLWFAFPFSTTPTLQLSNAPHVRLRKMRAFGFLLFRPFSPLLDYRDMAIGANENNFFLGWLEICIIDVTRQSSHQTHTAYR